MNDIAKRPFSHARPLDPATFAHAPAAERETLMAVAQTLESERDRLRGALGKGGRGTRGFIPPSIDVVDTMTWESLLQHQGVIERCEVQSGSTAVDILRMILEYCEPWNRDALFWMRMFYAAKAASVEVAMEHATSLALTVARAQRTHFEQQAVQARLAKARKAGASRKIVATTAQKKAQLVEIWLSGKYTTKARCIEEEAGALDLPISTAQKALREPREKGA